MKRFVLFFLAASVLSAAHHPAKKKEPRTPGVMNAATYPVRHPVKTLKPVVKVVERILW